MAEIETAQIDMEAARRRWLQPLEICKVLENYRNFPISEEAPNRPPGGSVFLFDRNVLRHFRKDGYNWRKDRDGRLAKEAHERLKLNNVGVLHCYYSYGEDGQNGQNIQRRSYWMIKQELSHIAFVHYREVEVEDILTTATTRPQLRHRRRHNQNFQILQGNREIFYGVMDAAASQKNEEVISNSNTKADSSAALVVQPYDYQRASPVTDTTGLNTTLALECGEAEPVYQYQASPVLQSIHELPMPAMQTMNAGSIPYHRVPISNNYQGQSSAVPAMTFESIQQGEESKTAMDNGLQRDIGFSSVHSSPMSPIFGPQFGSHELQDIPTITKPARLQQRHRYRCRCRRRLPLQHTQGNKENFNGVVNVDGIAASQRNEEVISNSKTKVDRSATSEVQSSGYQGASPVTDTTGLITTQPSEHEEAEPLRDITCTYQASPGFQSIHELHTPAMQPMDAGSIPYHSVPISNNYHGQSSVIRALSFGSIRQGEESKTTMGNGLQRDIDRSSVHSSLMSSMSGPEFGIHELQASEYQDLHVPLFSPLLSVEGATQEGLERQDWFFSELDNVFSIIDFYPNWADSGSKIKVLIIGKFLKGREELKNHKWACMFGEIEVPAEIVGDGSFCCHTPVHGAGRFPFCITRSNSIPCSEVREFEFRASPAEPRLRMRFGKLLSLGSGTLQISGQSVGAETSRLCGRISEMLKYDGEWERLLNLYEHDRLSAREQEVQMHLKENLHNWLLQKIVEGGKGTNVLDEYGQGVLHYVAALGYDWAIRPIIKAGVSVHFRDVNGWTALHWAASCGRERSVGLLISLKAEPGVLSNPTHDHPSGKTPADLAASNGHNDVAASLAVPASITTLDYAAD